MRIEVSNICFGYRKNKPVLNNITFSLFNEEILGIVGVSGCGKSTLLKIISGLITGNGYNFFSGTITFDGVKDTKMLRKHGMIGFMFQQPSLLPNLTLEENISLPLKMMQMNGRTAEINKELVVELIEMVGLNEYRKYLPKELSGGMQTRAILARTFITKPKLLLLDEPFSALDYGWKMDLYEKLNRLTKLYNSTAIIVTHDVNESVLLANKLIIISKKGKVMDQNIVLDNKPTDFSALNVSNYLKAKNEIVLSIQSKILNDKELLSE